VGDPKQSSDKQNDENNEHEVPEEPLKGISTKRVSPQIPKPKEEFSIEWLRRLGKMRKPDIREHSPERPMERKNSQGFLLRPVIDHSHLDESQTDKSEE
jgi:hypothetical protein